MLEIGFGKSPVVLAMAQEEPFGLFVAVDLNPFWCERLEEDGRRLRNLFVFRDEALHFLRECIPSGILDVMYLYYPTPYPANSRLVTPAFEEQCYRVLRRAGQVVIVTDYDPYAVLIQDVFDNGCWLTMYDRRTRTGRPQPGAVETDCYREFGPGDWFRALKR